MHLIYIRVNSQCLPILYMFGVIESWSAQITEITWEETRLCLIAHFDVKVAKEEGC